MVNDGAAILFLRGESFRTSSVVLPARPRKGRRSSLAAIALIACFAVSATISDGRAAEDSPRGDAAAAAPAPLILAQASESAPKGLPPRPTYIPGTEITPEKPTAAPKAASKAAPAPARSTAAPADAAPAKPKPAADKKVAKKANVQPSAPAPAAAPAAAPAPAAAAPSPWPVQPAQIAAGSAVSEVWQKLRPYVPAPGDFAVVPGSAMKPVLVQNDEFDFCQEIKCHRSAAVVGAWNGGAFDALRGEFRLHGGGHADYGGNEVYVFDFSTLTWRRETDPQPLTGPFMRDSDGDGKEDACPMPASGPAATHTYQGFVYVPKIDRYWLFGTVGYCSQGMGVSQAWEYNAHDKSWTELPQFVNLARYARLVVDARSGNVIAHVGNETGWKEIDPVARKVIRTLTPDPFGSYAEGPAVFDPLRGTLYAVVKGKNTDRLVAYSVPAGKKGKFETRRVTEWPKEAKKHWGLGLHASGLLVLWDGNDRIVIVEPDSGKSWESEAGGADYGSMGNTNKPGKVYSKWQYIPELDVFFGISNPDQGIVLYRLGGAPVEITQADPAPEANPSDDEDEELVSGDDGSEEALSDEDEDEEGAEGVPGAPDRLGAAAVQPPMDNGRPVPLEIEEAASWAEVCAEAVLCDPLGEGDVLYRGKVVESGPPPHGKHWRSIGHKMGMADSRRAEADPEIGGLRFYFPSESGSGSAGNFKTNFSPDYSFQVGPAEAGAPTQEVYIQFQVRYSCNFIWTDCDPDSPNYRKERRCYHKRRTEDGCTSSKIALISTGDRPGFRADACTLIQTAINHHEDHHLHGFHRCPRARGFGRRLPKVGGRYQGDAQPNGLYYCPRILSDYSMSAWNNSADTCFRLIDDKWITIQLHLRFGPWQKKPKKKEARLSHASIWGAIEGEHGGRQRLVIDRDFYAMQPETPNDFVGKIWLMPHLYGKDKQEKHPPFNVWYRNLVISEKPIPNPS